jgi:hypothetical protein
MVKPMIEARKMCLMPNRPASQPVSGIMIAEQTMYEVRAQATWSREAEPSSLNLNEKHIEDSFASRLLENS